MFIGNGAIGEIIGCYRSMLGRGRSFFEAHLYSQWVYGDSLHLSYFFLCFDQMVLYRRFTDGQRLGDLIVTHAMHA